MPGRTLLPCPGETKGSSAFAHLLLHLEPPLVRGKPCTLPPVFQWYDALLAARCLTPLIEARRLWRALARGSVKRATVFTLSMWIGRHKMLRKGLAEWQMGVAPEAWPPMAGRAFALADPPSPFEVAGWVFTEKRGAGLFGHLRASKCAACALVWWLLGFSPVRLANLLGRPVEPLLAEAVRGLMQSGLFALWSLGADLEPVRLELERALGVDRRSWCWSLRRVRAHPYVAAQFSGGPRLRPVSREVAGPSPVWRDMDEKGAWLARGGPSPARIVVRRKHLQMRDDFGRPEWVGDTVGTP